MSDKQILPDDILELAALFIRRADLLHRGVHYDLPLEVEDSDLKELE